MGLQLFLNRKWEEDSFNETNVPSVLRNAKEMKHSVSPFNRSEKIIAKHIYGANGLTNPAIAHLATGYAFSTCKRVFKKHAHKDSNGYFLNED